MSGILPAIRHHLQSNKRRSQYERIEKAIRAKAQIVSDLEFHRTMANFYTERVLDIDPHQDWWGFADAKQKQYDHQLDCTALVSRVHEADVNVIAQKNAFAALEKELRG